MTSSTHLTGWPVSSVPRELPAESLADSQFALISTIFGVLIAAPVFVSIGPSGLGAGQPGRAVLQTNTEVVDVAISSILLPLALLGSWATVRKDRVLRERLVFAVVATAAAATYGLARTGSLLGLLYAYQTCVPLAALVLGYTAALKGYSRRLLSAIAVTVAVFAVLHLALTALQGLDPVTGVQGNLGIWRNSKILRFFPSAAAIAVVLLAFPGSFLSPALANRRWLTSLLAAASGGVVLLSHSRTALILAAVSVVWISLVRAKGSPHSFVLKAAGMIVGAVLVARSSTTSVQRIYDVTGGAGDARRIGAWTSSVTEGLSRPLGSGFAAVVEVSTGGQRVAINRVAISENQYGEYLVRGGFALLIAFALLTTLAVGRTARRSRRSPVSNVGIDPRFLLVLILVWVVASTTTQLSLTETYLAPIIWCLVGMALEPPAHGGSADAARLADAK